MLRAVIILSAGFLLCAAGGASAQSKGKISTEEAKRVFQQNCGPCHIGTGRLGPPLRAAKVEGVEDAVKVTIKEGGERMPGFQYMLSDAQINAIIAYLKTVKTDLTEIDTSLDASFGYTKK